MKKQKLIKLALNKKSISDLNGVNGGVSTLNTLYKECGTGPVTVYTCPSIRFVCNASIRYACTTYNSVNRCKTIEVDANTLPIC